MGVELALAVDVELAGLMGGEEGELFGCARVAK